MGAFDTERYPYHAKVKAAACGEVSFLGALYDKRLVAALRSHCRLYVHGHQVGGTNPSLLESMAAGAPVLAHDNPFNRWVAGPAACYFRDVAGCRRELDRLLPDGDLLADMGRAGQQRCAEQFSPQQVLSDYEELLDRWWRRT